MKISNEDIIQSARRGRQKVDGQMRVEPWQGRQMVNSKWLNGKSIAVAASLIGFLAGFSLHANMATTDSLEARVESQEERGNSLEIRHDTIMQVQIVRDTVYQTRVVTKYEKPMLAESEESTPPEQKACSMLCDDIGRVTRVERSTADAVPLASNGRRRCWRQALWTKRSIKTDETFHAMGAGSHPRLLPLGVCSEPAER